MQSAIKKHVNILVVLSFIILSWLSIILLAHTQSLMGTGDMPTHLHQLREIQLALNHHELVYYGLNEFHGSAMMTLYPWLNLWPAVLLADWVKSKVLVIYLFFAFNELVVLLISYFSSLPYSRSKQVSYLFSIFYGLSTLYLDYGFADMDWGELLTMTFLPLVIFGAIALFQHDSWLELSAGMTLIISSHVLNTLIIVALLIVFFVLNLFKLRIRILLNLGKAVLLTTFTTIAVWFPAIRLMHLNWSLKTPPMYSLYGTPFRQIVGGALKGNISYGVSFFALAGVLLGALFFFVLNRYMKQLYIISVIIVIICSSWFKWWYLAPVSLMKMQFTWRLYIIPEICLSYIAAKVIVHEIKRFPLLDSLVFAGLILITIGVQFESQQRLIDINGKAPILNNQYLIHNNRPYAKDHQVNYIGTHLGTHPKGTIKTPENYQLRGNSSYDSFFNQKLYVKTDGHYMPTKALRHYNDMNNHYIRSQQGLASHLYNNGYNHFTFINRQPLTSVYLPLVIYSGEPLRLSMDGHQVPYISHQNMLYMKRIPKGHHQLSIRQEKDSTYRICEWSLILGLLIYITCITFKYVNIYRQTSV